MTKTTPNFRCKAHELIYQNIYNSFVNKPYKNKIINYGGRASGKSHAIADNIVFWLPENDNNCAVIITYSAQHKATSSLLIQKKLIEHGYQINQTNVNTGDIVYKFGNNNYIFIKSMETSSIEQLGEKFKNFELLPKCKLKLLCFEEFIACLNVFRGDLRKFENVLSSFNRHFCKRNLTFFTCNPPENKTHIFYKWMKNNSHCEKHFTTIYDLPERFQSVEDLKTAERLKLSDFDSFEHIYLGKAVSSGGLAFNVKDIFVKQGSKQYIKYYVQTDEATTNATVFTLFGLSTDGVIVVIDTYYHSSKQTNQRLSLSQYANELYNFLVENSKKYSGDILSCEILTDGLVFAQELINYGFISVQSIGKLKNRPLSYQLLKKVIDEGNFKIEQKSANFVLHEQLENAEKEITSRGVVVSKKHESSELEYKHVHSVDTCLYMCLRLQKLILGVNDE